MALLYCIERVAPLTNGSMAGDFGGKRTIRGKVLIEEAEELFKSAEGAE